MKVAAVQMDVKIGEKAHNLQRVIERLEEAARAGAELAVFPECTLTGYCFKTLAEARPFSESIPGPSTERIAQVTKPLGIVVVVGMLESDGEHVYNVAAVISPDGVLGTHRKIHLPGLGIDNFDQAGDRAFRVFETGAGKIGANICYDVSFPESARVLKLRGTQILAVPTNWPVGSDTWPHIPKVRAIENHMNVVAADRVGEERGFRFAGHSQIINFNGDVLAEAGETEETILYAEVDLVATDNNHVVRVPGAWEYNRIADRRPEMYGPITEPRQFQARQRAAAHYEGGKE